MIKYLLLGVLVVSSVACEQNPLKNYGDDVREAEDPQRKIVEPLEPIDRTALFVEEANGSLKLNFVEGEESHVDFTGRVSYIPKDKNGNPILDDDGQPVKIGYTLLLDTELYNQDGSSASFEKAKIGKAGQEKEVYRLSWTPPLNFVRGAYVSERKAVKVVMVTQKPRALRREFLFYLEVNRDIVRPKIVQVSDLPKATFEGEFLRFDVKVFDDDSVKQVYNEKPEGRAPQLNFVPIVRGRRDLSSYLQQLQVLPEEDSREDGLWTFKLALDLRDQDVVRGVDDFQFGIVAISRFGVKSLTEKVDLKVVNRVSEPVITWDSDIEAKVGEHLVFNFDVFSPKSVVDITGGPNASIDEKVELNQFTCGGVFVNDCKCNTVVRGFRRIHCTVNRVLQVGDEGRYDFHISATVKNPYEPRDNRQFKVMRRIAVQPAGTSSLGSGSKGGLE